MAKRTRTNDEVRALLASVILRNLTQEDDINYKPLSSFVDTSYERKSHEEDSRKINKVSLIMLTSLIFLALLAIFGEWAPVSELRPFMVYIGFYLLYVLLLKIFIRKEYRNTLKNKRKRLRMDRFVGANPGVFNLDDTPASHTQSSLHLVLGSRLRFDEGLEFRPNQGKNFSLANYSAARTGDEFDLYGSGQYLVVSVDIAEKKNLPHVFFDAVGNNDFRGKQSSLSFVYAKAKDFLVSYEFDKYFKTHVVKGSEKELLYFLTPEIMAVMIDKGSVFDFEIKDDRLYMYAPQHINFSYMGLKFVMELAQLFQTEFTGNTKLYKVPQYLEKQQALSLGVVAWLRRVTNSPKHRLLVRVITVVIIIILLIAVNILFNDLTRSGITPY